MTVICTSHNSSQSAVHQGYFILSHEPPPSEAVSVPPTAADVVSGSGSHPSDMLSLACQLITALEGEAHSSPPGSAPGPSHPPIGRCYANGGITIKEKAGGAMPPPKC